MANCSGKCGSCKSSKSANDLPRTNRNNTKDDIRDYLFKPKSEKKDDSDLQDKCRHYYFGTAYRWQCDICISEWVDTHDDDAVKETIEEFKKENRSVAARRIEASLKEKIRKNYK